MRIVPLVAVAVMCFATVADGAKYAPRKGTWHHDFVLPRIDTGHPLALSSLRGKKVLLIHFASW